jgi:hypothetical protein
VLPGSRIGRNVVVGAGSVVRGQIPDHCVVAGVPARIIRAYVAGDGWRPMRASASENRASTNGASTNGGSPNGAPAPTGTLADAEGVQGVPEPPHPVL